MLKQKIYYRIASKLSLNSKQLIPMRKVLSIFCALFLTATMTFAKENEALKLDEQKVNAEFNQLNKLEQYVNTHEGVTIEQAQNAGLTEGLTIDTNVSSSAVAGELPLNIPAFWWGCVLTWVGVLIVYLVTDKDKDQTKKALYGCLVSAGVYILWWVFVVAIGGRSWYW